MRTTNTKAQSGFSMLELILVIAVLTIIGVTVVLSFNWEAVAAGQIGASNHPIWLFWL